MFTESQRAVLRALNARPGHAISLSALGRILGKHPGVFQRGLNALVRAGYVLSERRGSQRLLRIDTAHPHYQALCDLAEVTPSPLPKDLYLGFPPAEASAPGQVQEPPGVYAASQRKVLIIAGPNGAGKTTFAREYLPREAQCHAFINADFLAQGLSPFAPDRAALQAGRLMLKELHRHLSDRRNLALETTLSGRRYARLIPAWQQMGYAVKLVFLSLPNVEAAIARVAGRVRQGGHDIPTEVIRRRFAAGRANFETVYKPLVDAWALYDSSGHQPVLLREDER